MNKRITIVLQIQNGNFYVPYSTSLSNSFLTNSNLGGHYSELHGKWLTAACYNSKLPDYVLTFLILNRNELNYNISSSSKNITSLSYFKIVCFLHPNLVICAHKNTWIIKFKPPWRITMKFMASPTPFQFYERKSTLHRSTIQRFLPLLTNALDAHNLKSNDTPL